MSASSCSLDLLSVSPSNHARDAFLARNTIGDESQVDHHDNKRLKTIIKEVK